MQDERCRKFLEFLEIIRRLRAPDGCPWDREQTHESLKSYVIEEAYELVEAIDSGADEAVKEELGDVLLQIALHSQIASEREAFDFGDVLATISKKMVYRHPHVFGDTEVSTAKDVEANWSRLKRAEKKTESVLDGIPRVLPGLLAAHRISERASKVGFDWPDIPAIFEKLDEELEEAKEAYRLGNSKLVQEELGDLLFVIVNLIRRMGGNAEEVMRQTTEKFSRRFREMEKALSTEGRFFGDLGIDEMDKVWETVKKKEKGKG
jgi:MazG family protein